MSYYVDMLKSLRWFEVIENKVIISQMAVLNLEASVS